MAIDATPQPNGSQAVALTGVKPAPDSPLEESLQGVADAFDRVR